MRRYYVFNIRSELMNVYESNPDNLYNMLESIYNMNKNDLTYAYTLYIQLCSGIDIIDLNNRIYLKMHNDLTYTKIDNEHVINNLYQNEISVLKVKKSHLVIDSNNKYTKFLNLLDSYSKNFFICDFKNKEFFFLNKSNLVV